MHKLLARQLRRLANVRDESEIPDAWRPLMAAVDDAYQSFDDDRRLLERSLDLTSRELLQRNQDLERSNRELEQFAYAASHDLREPLRNIRGYADFLIDRLGNKLGREGRSYTEGIQRGVDRMSRLIEGLLCYARVGNAKLKPTTVSLAEVVTMVREVLAIAIEESEAQIAVGPLPTVRGDPSMLGLLFQNLVGNAIKFRGSRAPRIEICAEDEPTIWVVVVRDYGIGIPNDELGRIFELFHRVHGEAEYPGTGIGLAVAKRIVELHDGQISADSKLGEGTSFRFSLAKEGADERLRANIEP